MLFFLLTKKPPKLIGKMCASDQRACKRPVWGDGRIDGEFYGLCSRCWHEHNAFHGHYVTMQANPAAASLSAANIRRLTFAEPASSDVFPESWLS